MPRPDHRHVTIVAPGTDAASVRSGGNAQVPHTFAYGVDLIRASNGSTAGRAWDGPLHDDAIAEASAQGATVYVRGVDAESMRDAIQQAGYEREETTV